MIAKEFCALQAIKLMHAINRNLIVLVATTVILIGLPLAGAAVAGQPVSVYLEFPPRTRLAEPAAFSWPAFALVSALALCLALTWVRLYLPFSRPHAPRDPRYPFPWWGWAASILLIVCWVIAWNRFEWFEPLQAHTFAPLWVSYIVVANAFSLRRTGKCLLTHESRYLITLFPLSAVFWWYFEYLNRFVQNWHYVNHAATTPLAYIGHATLAFSTVLPAFASTLELLRSYRTLATTRFRKPLSFTRPKFVAAVVLILASVALLGIAIRPDYLYPLVWIVPLSILVSLQALLGTATLFDRLALGAWEVVSLPALAALVCGILWELWNYYSVAKWIYSIPYVHTLPVFEMPLLGYAGYLLFGLECAAIAALITAPQHSRHV